MDQASLASDGCLRPPGSMSTELQLRVGSSDDFDNIYVQMHASHGQPRRLPPCDQTLFSYDTATTVQFSPHKLITFYSDILRRVVAEYYGTRTHTCSNIRYDTAYDE